MYQNNQDNLALLKQLKKRRNIYTIIFAVFFLLFSITGAIALVSWTCFGLMGVFAGFGLLAINCFRYYKTGGRKQGGGLWWLLLFLFGGIVIPWLTVVISSKVGPLAKLILGVEME